MCSLGEESAVREGEAYPAKPTRPSNKNYRQSYSKVCDVVTCTVSQILSRVCI